MKPMMVNRINTQPAYFWKKDRGESSGMVMLFITLVFDPSITVLMCKQRASH